MYSRHRSLAQLHLFQLHLHSIDCTGCTLPWSSQAAHEDRNLARALTPAERREKKLKKLFDDSGERVKQGMRADLTDCLAGWAVTAVPPACWACALLDAGRAQWCRHLSWPQSIPYLAQPKLLLAYSKNNKGAASTAAITCSDAALMFLQVWMLWPACTVWAAWTLH